MTCSKEKSSLVKNGASYLEHNDYACRSTYASRMLINVFVIGCAECSLYDYNLIRVLELRKLVIKVISLPNRVKNRARTLHTKLLLPSSLLVRRLSQL